MPQTRAPAAAVLTTDPSERNVANAIVSGRPRQKTKAIARVRRAFREGWLVNPFGSKGAGEHAKPGLAAGQARVSLLGCQLAAACSLAEGTM